MRFQTCLFTEPAGSSLPEAPRLHSNLSLILKRMMDLTGGLLLIVLSLPWMLHAAMRIKRRTGGPVLQSVEMLGLHCRPFQARIFSSGKGADLSWATKRIPLLIQLVKGEMSLVGPPPVLVCGEASPLQWNELRRLALKPGLTGPWLLPKRGKAPSRIAGQAGSNWSLAVDVAVLWRTAVLLLATGGRMGKEEDYASTG